MGRKPVAWPVSASSETHRSRVERAIQMRLSVAQPADVIRPAACQVVPAVS